MKSATIVITAISGMLVTSPAFADRLPNRVERAAVERVLRSNGFVSWSKIELHDDSPVWEVDDARSRKQQDGKFDLKIDARTMKIVARKRED